MKANDSVTAYNIFEYPFDNDYILQNKRRLKKELLSSQNDFIEKKIAILGGSTTSDILQILELFLLHNGIKPSFYESEYDCYWSDIMSPNMELEVFRPDVIFIHTTNRNIQTFPSMTDSVDVIQEKLDIQYRHFFEMWEKLVGGGKYGCPIIQNNFEYPTYRLLGNRDAYDLHGKTNFINKLNELFYEYARNHEKFYIHDINYLSARYGLDDWSDSFYWHMYKYAPSVPAIPELAHSVANIIKSICGKNKKAFALDLDNTLWGGVVGDDGVDALEIGQETAIGQAYDEFGQYLKAHKDLGILLTVSSKNEEENAIAGLNHPDFVLNPEDFVTIKANWNPKSENIKQIADELNLLPESFVFVDDNPAERELVRGQLSGIAVPEIESVENYIKIVDHSGYFEITDFTEDDKHRTKMYQTENARKQLQQKFVNYNEYLISLEMHASIGPFQQLHMTRIAQLTNKSNQFNLTTKRFTAHELESVAESDEYIDLSGQLSDKFGDNGVVSVVVGRIDESLLHLELWLMSCRVLKRDMELAMLDSLVGCALECGINKIIGYYYPTKKNGIVKDFYEDLGFQKIDEDEQGNTKWSYDTKTHERKNYVIEVEIQ